MQKNFAYLYIATVLPDFSNFSTHEYFRNSTVDTVEQELKFVGDEYGKLLAVKDRLRRGLEPPVLIFVQTKQRAEQLYAELKAESSFTRVDLIHSDRNQEQVGLDERCDHTCTQ